MKTLPPFSHLGHDLAYDALALIDQSTFTLTQKIQVNHVSADNFRIFGHVLELAYKRGAAEALEKDAADERALREMLAIVYCGPPHLYADDGELQDNRAAPRIDFKRDTVRTIAEKMAQRGINEFTKKEPT